MKRHQVMKHHGYFHPQAIYKMGDGKKTSTRLESRRQKKTPIFLFLKMCRANKINNNQHQKQLHQEEQYRPFDGRGQLVLQGREGVSSK
jgi:hypothetical protein